MLPNSNYTTPPSLEVVIVLGVTRHISANLFHPVRAKFIRNFIPSVSVPEIAIYESRDLWLSKNEIGASRQHFRLGDSGDHLRREGA